MPKSETNRLIRKELARNFQTQKPLPQSVQDKGSLILVCG
jgi:hypothetical protein